MKAALERLQIHRYAKDRLPSSNREAVACPVRKEIRPANLGKLTQVQEYSNEFP